MRIKGVVLFLTVNCVLIFANEIVDNEANRNSSFRLFFTNPRWLYYTKGVSAADEKTFVTMDRSMSPINFDYHAGLEKLFWTSKRVGYWTKSSALYSMRWNYQCSGSKCEAGDIELLREERNWNPRSLAVDYIGDKLYIVDTFERSVNVFDLNGQNKATVFEHKHLIPMEVILDPPEGLMFILAANIIDGFMQIYRSNMDGTEQQLIISDSDNLGYFVPREKTGFTIDPLKKRIFFANFNKSIIESTNYEGHGRLTVVKAEYPISISVHENTLYWSDSKVSAQVLFLCIKKKCFLRKCQLTVDGICQPNSGESIIDGNDGVSVLGPHTVKAVDALLQQKLQSPCGVNNGGCHDHCLLKKSSFGCSCNTGYRLAADGKSCDREQITQVYDGTLIPGKMNFTNLWNVSSMSKHSFLMPRNLLAHLSFGSNETIFHGPPFRFFQVSRSGRSLLDYDFSPVDSMTSSEKLDQMLRLLGLHNLDFRNRFLEDARTLRHYKHGQKIARVLAYDWISKNVYYVKLADDAEVGKLLALKYDGLDWTYDEVLQTDASLAEIPPPVSLVAHPYAGLLFASFRNGSVLKMNSNGSGGLILSDIGNATVLAVDFVDDKLYWLNTNNHIHYTDLEGRHGQRLLKLPFDNVELLYVYSEWIYAKSMGSIWRFHKRTGKAAGHLLIEVKNFYLEDVGFKVSARDGLTVDAEKHPCALKNGGCDEFCFAVPEDHKGKLKRNCACVAGHKLSENESKCSVPKQKQQLS